MSEVNDQINEQIREQNKMDKTRTALFMCAAHCQGGHSDAGRAAADALGVPFPITMQSLEHRANSEGLDPDELWPWLKPMRTGKR